MQNERLAGRTLRGLRAFLGLCLEAAKEFMRDRCHALGAALAFYALLSIAPLVLLMMTCRPPSWACGRP